MNQNQNQPQWTSVGGQSNNERWAPQKELNYNAQDPRNVIMGYLKDITERPGNNGPFNVAEIVTVDPGTRAFGASFDVAGGKVLDDMLNEISLGTFICIKFTGKARSKSGNTYNTWELFKDDNAIPFSQLGGHVKVQSTSSPVFNNNSGQQNNQQQGAPVFNNNASGAAQNQPQNAPVFGQNTSSQPVVTQQQNQQPQTSQNTYSPPTQNTQQYQAPPIFNPVPNNAGAGNAPNPAAPTFGGQPLPQNPFTPQNGGNGQQLPF